MALPSFRLGKAERYLPNFQIAFLRSRNPQVAKFLVPLWFSKLDLRDYLWNAYGVEILAVRSYVKQSRVQSGKDSDIRPQIRRWHRPRAKKYMTVDLARPFVWPEEPENHEDWGKTNVQNADKDQKKFQERHGTTKDTLVDEEKGKTLREQAKALLEGKEKWKPSAYTQAFNTAFARGRA